MSQTNWNDFTPVDSKGARKPAQVEAETNWDDFTPAPEPAGVLRKAGDMGLSVAKGVIGVPEAAVGIADIASGGQVGKFLENEGGAFGFRPKQAKEYLSSLQSDDLQGKQREFKQADGIIDKTKTALSNPSLVANAVAESVPLMGAGAVPARAVLAVAPKVGALAAGAIGEGVAGAGSAAEQVRQETKDGLLTPKQAGLAAASGAATAAFGVAGGKLAQRLGIGDVDTMLAQGAARTAGVRSAKSIPRQVVEGAIAEGWLEELPQSVSEQILQNLSLDKPWHEGVEDAAVMGTLSGMAMGGTAAGVAGFSDRGPQPGDQAPPPPAQPPAPVRGTGPTLALPAPDRGVIQVGGDGTARTPAYQKPGYVGDVTDVEAKAPRAAAADFASILDTDNVYSGWSNVQDGTDRATMRDQMDYVGRIYSGKATPENAAEVAADLSQQFKWFRAASPEQKRAAINALMVPAAPIDPVREAVAAAAEQGGALSGAALTAIDTGVTQAMQPAPEQAPPQISLEEADARDRAAYEQFFASADSDPVVGRYFENDDDIPDFDAASNASEEDFLRALGATDEDIQDAIATARQSAIPQSRPAVDAGAQANEPAGPSQGAGGNQAAAGQGQVAPSQPSNSTGTPTATIGQQGATARPGPGFGLKDALAQIRAKKQQEAANAQAATPEAAPAATAVSAARPGAVEAAGVERSKLLASLDQTGATREMVLNAQLKDAQYRLAQITATTGILPADRAARLSGINQEIFDLNAVRDQARALDERDRREGNTRFMLQGARQEVDAAVRAGAVTPEAAQSIAAGAKKTGNAADAAEAVFTAVDSAAAAAGPAPDIKAITAKQIPDMTDGELQQAIAHYGPEHKRTAKLQKEVQRRAGAPSSATTEGTANVPQAAQAQQASPQPTQAAAAPAAGPAPTNTAAPAPAGASTVRALNDGAPAENTGAQAAPAAGAQGAAPAEPEFTTIKTVYGDSVTVRTADLNSDKPRLRQYTKDGKSKAVPAIHRDNLDLTGDKRASIAKEDADNPLFNVITTKDGSAFATEAAASRELNRRAMGETHEVVAASDVQDGAQGFVIRRKLDAPAQETTHNGTRIYPTKIKMGDEVKFMWAVESPDNQRRRAAGERTIGGDSLHETIEQAKAAAEREAKRDAEQQAAKAEQDAADKARRDAEEARKAANRPKSVVERRKDAILDGPSKIGQGTKRAVITTAVDNGYAIEAKMVYDHAAKKRDQEAVDRASRAGYILGVSNENLPLVKAGNEAKARLKEGKYEKPEYRVYQGSDTKAPFREITKTEYDYAQELKAQRAAAPQAEAAQPTTPQQADNEFLPEGWTKSVNGFTKRPVYRMEQGVGQPFAVVTQTDGMTYEVQIRHGDKQLTTGTQRGALSEVLAAAEAELGRMTQADSVTHADPGEKAEAATPSVVTDSLKKAARNEDTKPSEMRKWLVAEIDKELLQAPDRADYDEAVKRLGEKDAISGYTGNGPFGKNNETGYITFDVPGDGKYKVRNSVRGLLEFRKNVMASQGFKDSGQKRVKPEQNDGVQGGSGSNMAAITNMVEEGDFEAARDYAEAVGIKLEDVKVPRGENAPAWKMFLSTGKVPEQKPVSREWTITNEQNPNGTWSRVAKLKRTADGAEYEATVTGTLDNTRATYVLTKDGKEYSRLTSGQPFGTAIELAENAMPAANDKPAPSKASDTGWNMAGTGYGGKRYIGRNITLDDGREVVARVYENAGNYDEVEIKVDGARKFTVRDSFNAQDKADAFIKTLTSKDGDASAPVAEPPAPAGRTYLAVPFNEKDYAKRAGAKWDEGKKLWYADPVGGDGAAAGEININLKQYVPQDSTKDDRYNYYGDKALATAVALNASARDGVQYDTIKRKHPDGMMMWSVVKAGEQTQAAGSAKSPTRVTPQISGNPEKFIKVAADSVRELRSVDVDRVLTETPVQFRAEVASYIRDQRKDLADEVDDVMADIQPKAAAPAPAPSIPAGPRREPAKVSLFAPYEDGDIVTINGQDWTVKQDTPGWYLTTTGNWRGQHPTIRNVKAMADLIRAVEQAAVAQPAKAQPEAPKLTPAEAKSLMAWEDLGQKDGVKTHALTFYESQADKDAKRGRMIVARVTKEVDSGNWTVEVTGEKLAVLGMAKKKAEQVGMEKAVADGFVAEDNPFAEYNALAKQYGYEVRPDGAIGRDGKFPGPKMKVKGGRLRIESGSGDLLASYAGTSPDGLGKFLESFWYAEKKAGGLVEQGATKPTVAAKPAAPAAPIEDAGEKIGGARKDRWKERGLNLDDLDAMTEAEGAELATKANVWKPDYEALSKASEPVTAAMVKTIYDQLAAKPKKNTPEGRRQYVQMMRIVRDVLTEAKGPDAVRTAYLEIRNRAGLNTMDPQAKTAARELLFSVYKGRSDPFVLDGGDLMKVKKMVTDGFPAKGEPWKTRLTVGRAEGGPGTTERGIEIYVERSAEVGTPLTREQILGGFYRVTTKDNKTVAFAPTKADAEAAAATVYERDMKGKKDGKPEPVRPNLDELKRENLPQRIDRDVTSEDFVRDLGFRGVEFGLWSAQDERQRILNMAYDGLMDLAEIMGVPPKAMSLNGTLGMAFGARGGGRFAAHYEPGKLVINMTKIRGGGSMAHEWAHAMDHYFGELDKPDAYTTQARGASGWYSEDQYNGVPRRRMERVGNEWKNVEKMRLDNLRPEMAAAFDEVMRALFSKQVTKAEMVRSHELDLERTEALAAKEQDADMKAMYTNMAENKRQALDELRQDPEDRMYDGRGRSNYASQAQELSGKSENGYWTRPTEMFARAFESWVFDKVTAMGARSDYLVHGVEEDRFAGGGYRGNPYPTGEERARINAAFDKLASTIQTKETDKGVALFSSADSTPPAKPLSLDRVNQLVQEALAGIRGAPPVEVTARPADVGLQVPAGSVGYGVTLRSGDIYVFQSAMGSDLDVFKTVFHELFHRGVRVLVPKGQYVQTMLDLAKGDSRIQQLAIEWKNTEMGQKQKENLREQGYTGAELTGQYEALAIEEALAAVAEEIKAEGRLGSKPKNMTIRFLANWLAKLADLAGMKKLAQGIRNMSYNEAERFVMSAIDRSGEPVQAGRTDNLSAKQVKSAIGNNGNFDPANADIRFRSADLASRAGMADLASKARDELNKTFGAPGKLSWWHKTVGTMFNLAERSPAFKRVFDAAQGFVDDVSYYATDAAELAPRLLPKLETWRDIAKRPITAADNAAVAKPVFEGTLDWARDESGKPVRLQTLIDAAEKLTPQQKAQRLLRNNKISEGMLKAWQGLPLDQYEKLVASRYESQMLKAGVVWTPAELKSLFKLTDAQVELYQEFRAATDRSLDTMARADMLRYGGKDVADLRDMVMDAKDAQDAAKILRDHLQMLARENPDRAGEIGQLSNGMLDRAARVLELQEQGYAPLSRFGQYTVDVVDENGERQYFGLFETAREANLMAIKMRKEFGQDAVTQGTLSNDEFKLLAGITPESLEMFGNMLGLESDGDQAKDQAFQEYLRRTKTNRSAMRRLIHRQGIAGYSEDVGRVLASFIYSNSRQTSAGLHMGELGEAITAIPKQQGELKDAAIQLSEYVKNPQEEAQAVRGLLFAQYLGGSIASAFVNMSQPAAVTFPWLSQFGGAKQAAAELGRAARNLASRSHRYEADLAAALKHAEEEGTVSPQEVHQLMAQARGSGSLRPGDGTRAGDARAAAGNALTRLSMAWGKVFGAAEQVNRRMTFIAAFRVAKAQGMANPAAFAKKAVIETQFTYSKANKMKWGRGAVGATAMTFKTYSIAYLELLGRMWSQGGPDGKKAVLLALGMLMLMGGAGGLPFAEDAEDLIDGLAQMAGYNISSKKAKQELLESLFGEAGAGFIERGITGLPGMPLDVSGRLGMGNLIPATGLFKEKTDYTRDVLEVVGPVGDLAKRVASGTRSILTGDVGAGLLQMAPAAVRNAAKGADMAARGMYRDDKGYKVLDTSPTEAAMKAIGFQPASVSKVQEANFINQQAKNFYNMQAQEIRAKWAKGIFEKDPELVAEARADLDDWNRKNPDQRIVVSMPAVLKRVREMGKTKDQRIADTAPKAMRQQLRDEAAKARATL